MKYCTYITRHPEIGKYYIGKSTIKKVMFGGYKGSGHKLIKYFKKHHKSEWRTQILQCYATELEAYEAEAKLITVELLKSPDCLNLKLGGFYGPTRVGFKDSEETKKIKSEAAKLSYANGRKPANITPEIREKIAAAKRGSKISEQGRANMSKAAKSKKPRTAESYVTGWITRKNRENLQ